MTVEQGTAQVRMRPSIRKGPSVLVVEDSATDERLIHALLDRLGCAYDVVLDGPAAVSRATRSRYDVVFMDLELPSMDGLEATRQIRGRLGPTGPRIVAVSSHDQDWVRSEGMAAGIDHFLPKPVRIATLRSLLLDV